MLTADSARSLGLKAKLFRGFGDPSRLSILEALRDGRRSVSEVVEITALTQSNVSNHLACLRDCGLVVREQEGRFAYYYLADPRVEGLLGVADDILTEVAQGVYVCPRFVEPEDEVS